MGVEWESPDSSVENKKKKKRDRYLNDCEEAIRENKKANKEAKKEVAIAKNEAYKELYEGLKSAEGEKKAIRIAKQRNKESQDLSQAKLIKNSMGNVLMEEGEMKKRWRDYFEELINIENNRVRRLVYPAEETEVPQVNEEEVLAAA